MPPPSISAPARDAPWGSRPRIALPDDEARAASPHPCDAGERGPGMNEGAGSGADGDETIAGAEKRGLPWKQG
jgi:hypothetical protein